MGRPLTADTRAEVVRRHRESWPAGIPYGECWCGCGRETPINKATRLTRGRIAGEPARFVRGHKTRRDGPFAEGVHYKVEQRDYETPCHIWQRATSHGYGTATLQGGRPIGAHVKAVMDAGREVPFRYHVHHRCDEGLCVNPDHLEVLSPVAHAKMHHRPRDAVSGRLVSPQALSASAGSA